ncbi:hypothetical protein V2J09_006150 [Rumex salicifolius]
MSPPRYLRHSSTRSGVKPWPLRSRPCSPRTHGPKSVFLLVYVDDLLVISTASTLADQFVAALSSEFLVNDLGALCYFLGILVIRDDTDFSLCQTKYIHDLI